MSQEAGWSYTYRPVAPWRMVARLGKKKVMTLAADSCNDPPGFAVVPAGEGSTSRWLTSTGWPAGSQAAVLTPPGDWVRPQVRAGRLTAGYVPADRRDMRIHRAAEVRDDVVLEIKERRRRPAHR